MNRILIFFVVVLFLSACNNESEGSIIAKVYDKELHSSDIYFLFKNQNLSISDSTKVAKDYVDKWVEEQILLHQSTDSIIEMSLINDKANHYKNILIINQLENNYVNTHIDTTVTQNEYVIYYKNHKDDFQLNDYLVKILYVKVPVDAPNLEQLKKWYKLKQTTDIIEIENYAKLYASNFYYDTINWIYFEDLTKEIPLVDFNKDRFITRKSKTIIDENDYFYFLNVLDYKLKNTTSPLEFEKHNIKQRILNTRIKELKEEYKKQNIEKAYNEKAVEIY